MSSVEISQSNQRYCWKEITKWPGWYAVHNVSSPRGPAAVCINDECGYHFVIYLDGSFGRFHTDASWDLGVRFERLVEGSKITITV